MKKYALAAILIAGCVHPCMAQTEDTSAKKEKKIDHYVGVQLNGLIRQVFNFGTPPAVNNPYLLIYHANLRKSGWGLRAGAGYEYNSSFTNNGVNEVTTNINDMRFRLGVEKAFDLSKKWSAGAGLDGTFNNDDDKTTSVTKGFDTTTTVTKTKMMGYGGGAMGWLRYHITDRVQIGTEASFYYTTGKQNNMIAITKRDGFTKAITTTETTSKPTLSRGTFSAPVVFYLIVKF
jgi:hypothetical protein